MDDVQERRKAQVKGFRHRRAKDEPKASGEISPSPCIGFLPLVTKILAPLLCYTAGCGLKAFFHHQPKVYEPFQRIGVHIIDGDVVLDSRLWTFGQYLL